jgi:hypothetical protein
LGFGYRNNLRFDDLMKVSNSKQAIIANAGCKDLGRSIAGKMVIPCRKQVK